MKLSNKTLTQIELATRRAFPKEMCGFIYVDGTFEEQVNISTNDRTKSFEVCPLKFLEEKDSIFAIIHSHTQLSHLHPQTPSLADLVLANTYKRTLYITSLVNGVYNQPLKVPPDPSNNYTNRPYIFGVSDCGILIRDYYHFEFDISIELTLESHLTVKKDWEGLVKKTIEGNQLKDIGYFEEDRVASSIVSNGLLDITQVGKLQKGDLLITSILGYFNNHAMIYIGDGLLLNQAEISKIEPLELYLNKITKVYRHPDLVN